MSALETPRGRAILARHLRPYGARPTHAQWVEASRTALAEYAASVRRTETDEPPPFSGGCDPEPPLVPTGPDPKAEALASAFPSAPRALIERVVSGWGHDWELRGGKLRSVYGDRHDPIAEAATLLARLANGSVRR